MTTTIIDVEFNEESIPELRIKLPCKRKTKNAENYQKIACRKKRCEKIPDVLITIERASKKGNFWCLEDVPKPASILVITVFLFSGSLNFPPFLLQ